MIEIILYVADQERSKLFYEKIFQHPATLHVPGMTQFQLDGGLKLGLMPENGIAKIIHPATPHPSTGNGIPRCELYLVVLSVEEWLLRAVTAGAKLISPPADRDWGDRVAYTMDPDGHILAFAQRKGN